MTDSEKLDLLLTEIQSIKGELQDMKSNYLWDNLKLRKRAIC